MGIMNEVEGYSIILSNIKLNVFTEKTFDNGDYGRENASQQVTNRVLHQYTLGSFQNVNKITQISHKNRLKSIHL